MKVTTVVGDRFLAVVRYVGEQFFVQFVPAGRLQDFNKFVTALDGANGEHLRTLTVHGIQHFVRFDAQLHELRSELAYDEFGEVLFPTHLDIPLHQQPDHSFRIGPFLSTRNVQTPPRYQKHPRIATSPGRIGQANTAVYPAVWPLVEAPVKRVALAWLTILVLFVAAFKTAEAAPIYSPATETTDGVTQQLYLLPAADTSVQLQTHLANISVTYGGEGSVSSVMDAVYRIHNAADERVTLPLLVYAGKGSAQAQEVSLTADGQFLGLSPASGGLSTQIEVDADTRMSLRLRYRVTTQDSPLVTIRYAPSVLRRWPGPVSTRIEFALPDAIVRESWTTTAPDSWTYATSAPDVTAIKWLYDSTIPNEEFIVQFVAPGLWSQIEGAEAVSGVDGQVAAFLERGNLYRRLAETETADDSVRERFAAQAIAAYTDGLAQEASASSEELAQMHMWLASLYRSRAAQPAHDSVPHAALMVDEASAALSLFGPQDSRRGELQQWLGDGLGILFADAQARGDWQQAGRVVDQMTSLPPSSVDPALVEEAQQIVLVQQALQLLRRGEQDAAAALVGAKISDETAKPPVELQPLFSSWQITVTAEPASVALNIRAMASPGREGEAQSEMAELAARWQSEAARITSQGGGMSVSLAEGGSPPQAVGARIEAPISVDGEMLASAVPVGADWALLRSALAQLDPQQEERSRFFLREVLRSQPMDLRSAGDQWAAMAANLGQEATRISAEATTGDASSLLLAEIRAANYRNMAEAWRTLARDSWLLFQFRPGEDGEGQTRAWYATATSAPMVLTVQTQSLDMNLVAGVATLAMAIVAALSGLLWWLM